jgi:hypothetical protein
MQPIPEFLKRAPSDIRLLIYDNVVSLEYEYDKVLTAVGNLHKEALKIMASQTPRAQGFITQRNKVTTVALDRVFGLIACFQSVNFDDPDRCEALLGEIRLLMNDMDRNNMQYRRIYQDVTCVTIAFQRFASCVFERNEVVRSVILEHGTAKRSRLLDNMIRNEDSDGSNVSMEHGDVESVPTIPLSSDVESSRLKESTSTERPRKRVKINEPIPSVIGVPKDTRLV